MKSAFVRRVSFFAAIAALLLSFVPVSMPLDSTAFGQSRRQPPTNQQKKNQRPGDGEQQKDEPKEQLPPDIVKEEADPVKITAALVNVEAVVYHKKSGQIVTGLKRGNFAVYEDGVQQEITNFSTPDAPITVTMILEYSRLTNMLGGNQFEPGRYEVLRPMAMFLQQFIKPPDDYVSVVAYDMRPTPLTDFTNDPGRINQVINLLFRNRPASSEANLFDALKLVLNGGKADAVVLEDSEQRTMEYAGMASLQGRRKAVFLIASGVDTFSKINYDQARKIAQNAGVPIYIIGTGELFFKRFEDRLGANDGLLGATQPGRMTLLQAKNTLNTFAKETGGKYYPVTFEGEIPGVLQSINALMRNQYSIGYRPVERRDGKQRKIQVRVDVNGDGQFDDKEYIIQSRQFYNAPKA
ncbi:MAG TPA: VWA domain-containing protein [Pyrinomonadaceae bacterium]|jgi:VWFA-related protein|nr:VWA domain-containing protein [Pyrinomonadaceae bacterium]